ncbi:hypothetical protein [Dictyobacter arantiisoli]|uniref:VCBS repeat-containing protein n=1 Tax=Dictyobacter arantiisoli TaxID=2014874 RepID=A0A5A5T5D8_9CHLR|nr:hypothetical protein [Dictyobacter arantiisoli]GCF06610.1 hypothetical protein KDI_01740 [Dictyobacter arantiisoli]
MEQSSYVQAARRANRRTSASQAAAIPDVFAEEYDDIWPTHHSSSVRRYRSDVQMESGRAQADEQWSTLPDRQSTGKRAIPQRRTATQPSVPSSSRHAVDTEDVVLPDQRVPYQYAPAHPLPRFHWTVWTGLALFCMIIGWFVVSSMLHWWQITRDDWHYGRPRTYQIDQVVGHNDTLANPSHFIALNLNRHVEVIEFPGGDATHARVYMGPVLVGVDQDLVPVTLTFVDANHDGKLDMIMNVQDSHIIFLNTGSQFSSPGNGEHI